MTEGVAAVQQNAELVSFVQKFQGDFEVALNLLKDAGLLVYRRAGNISLRIPGEDRLVIANTNPPRAGVAAVFDLHGQHLHGELSGGLSEVVGVHAAVLRQRPDVNSVIHLHSPYLTGFAAAGRALPSRYVPLLGASPDALPATAWGTRDDAEPVLGVLGERPDVEGALLANHGPFVWGKGVAQVTQRFITLEEAAHVFFVAHALGGVAEIPSDAHERARERRKRYYGSSQNAR